MVLVDSFSTFIIFCFITLDRGTFFLDSRSILFRFLAKILVPEGSKDIPVGQPIAITVCFQVLNP